MLSLAENYVGGEVTTEDIMGLFGLLLLFFFSSLLPNNHAVQAGLRVFDLLNISFIFFLCPCVSLLPSQEWLRNCLCACALCQIK